MPLRLGHDAEFSALRSALESAGYTEQAVCRRLNLAGLSEYRLEGPRHLEGEPDDPLGLLIWLLIEGGPVSDAGATRVPLQELEALNVVTGHPEQPGKFSATVLLAPVRGLWVATDRSRPMDGTAGPRPSDWVFAAISASDQRYLSLVDFSPCDTFLDLCSGSGVAALIAARGGARHVWAFDVTARSTHFAEFNRRLNLLPNISPACGDLYEPAGELTFDRIAAHPPYLPEFQPSLVCDAGGPDGEQVVKRIVVGVPRHLRPGGRFYSPLLGTDREKPFELRVREWLGEAESQFDVMFIGERAFSPRQYIAEAIYGGRTSAANVTPWLEILDRLGVRSLVFGFLMLQRRDSARPVFTVRRKTGPRSRPREMHWLLAWETFAAANADAVLALRPRASRSTRLRVEHRLTQGAWAPHSYRLATDYPFPAESGIEPWTALLLTRANGSRTVAELLAGLQREGAVSPQMPPSEFGRSVAELISLGFLEAERVEPK